MLILKYNFIIRNIRMVKTQTLLTGMNTDRK
jgi:hypothetical protein